MFSTCARVIFAVVDCRLFMAVVPLVKVKVLFRRVKDIGNNSGNQ